MLTIGAGFKSPVPILIFITMKFTTAYAKFSDNFFNKYRTLKLGIILLLILGCVGYIAYGAIDYINYKKELNMPHFMVYSVDTIKVISIERGGEVSSRLESYSVEDLKKEYGFEYFEIKGFSADGRYLEMYASNEPIPKELPIDKNNNPMDLLKTIAIIIGLAFPFVVLIAVIVRNPGMKLMETRLMKKIVKIEILTLSLTTKEKLTKILIRVTREAKMNVDHKGLKMYLDEAGSIIAEMFTEIYDLGFNRMQHDELKSKITTYYQRCMIFAKSMNAQDEPILPNAKEYFESTAKKRKQFICQMADEIVKISYLPEDERDEVFKEYAINITRKSLANVREDYKKILDEKRINNIKNK